MKLQPLQRNPYSNYKMLSLDGVLMTRTSYKKAKWYVDRELASWIDDTTFQLNFIPNGLGKHDDPFYTEELDNCCVICRAQENLTKHHILPYMFRKILPKQYSSYNHYDILPVCSKCHEEYE